MPVNVDRAANLPPIRFEPVPQWAGELMPVTVDRAANLPPISLGRAAHLSGVTTGRAAGLNSVVTLATDRRHKLHDEGWDLLDPSICLARDPMITFRLSSMIKQLQQSGNPQLAAGLMVWVHSLRALTRPELRSLGRDMWRGIVRQT